MTSKIPDRVMVAFTDKTDLVSISLIQPGLLQNVTRGIKPYKDSKVKISSAPGKIDVECVNNFLVEYISNADVAKVVAGSWLPDCIKVI